MVERTCTDVADRFSRAFGPRPFVSDRAMAQRFADLHLYMRQHHGERELGAIADLARPSAFLGRPMTRDHHSSRHGDGLHHDRRYFDEMYDTTLDPWGFETSWYERRKFAMTVAALPRTRYRRAMEPGCATGSLTELLSARCDELVAYDFVPAVVAAAIARLADHPGVEDARSGVPDVRHRRHRRLGRVVGGRVLPDRRRIRAGRSRTSSVGWRSAAIWSRCTTPRRPTTHVVAVTWPCRSMPSPSCAGSPRSSTSASNSAFGNGSQAREIHPSEMIEP